MGAPKGRTKAGGRKAGTPNKSTVDIRNNFQLLVEGNLERLQDDLTKLKPAERVKAILEMAKFVVPTLKAVEYKGDVNVEVRPKIEFVRK